VELPVTVSDARRSGLGSLSFDTRDLSVGGAFLRSDLLLEVNEDLEMCFELPDGVPVKVRARVVHVVRDPEQGGVPGMGVAFRNLSNQDRERMRIFLSTAGHEIR
jgi:hypothetical protein